MRNDGQSEWQHAAAANGAVTFVNRFTVHAQPEEFERVFAETSVFMARQAGFLGNTLLRHAEDQQTYLNIAQWRDIASFRKAVTDPSFRPHADALRALSTSEPNLYVPRRVFSAEPVTGSPAPQAER